MVIFIYICNFWKEVFFGFFLNKNWWGVIMNGYVYLVGVGLGDEGFIIKKVIECLKCVDIVLYDCLLNFFFFSYIK